MGKKLKVYGERNTNTNYIEQLIRLNLEAQQLRGVVPSEIARLRLPPSRFEFVRDEYFEKHYHETLGWKHTSVKLPEDLNQYPIFRDENLSVLTLTKNPYSWLLSLYRRPYTQYYRTKPDFETFLTSPWQMVGRENILKPSISPIELWNIKNLSYLQLGKRKALNIKSENLFRNPDAVIEQISQQFCIDRRSVKFTDFTQPIKDPQKDTYYYRDYYLNEKWRHEINKNAVSMINREVDRELMSFFGYEVL